MQNNFFIKSYIYILLISQLCGDISSSLSILFDKDANNIELSVSDKEVEDDKKEDKKDKIVYRLQFTFNQVNFLKIKNNFKKRKNFTPSNYIEINSPPPEYYYS